MGHSFRDIKDLHGVRFKASHCPAGLPLGSEEVHALSPSTGGGRGRAPVTGIGHTQEGITGSSSHQAGRDKGREERAGRGPGGPLSSPALGLGGELGNNQHLPLL